MKIVRVHVRFRENSHVIKHQRALIYVWIRPILAIQVDRSVLDLQTALAPMDHAEIRTMDHSFTTRAKPKVPSPLTSSSAGMAEADLMSLILINHRSMHLSLAECTSTRNDPAILVKKIDPAFSMEATL